MSDQTTATDVNALLDDLDTRVFRDGSTHMNINDLSAVSPGDTLDGGFYAGQFRIGNDLYALIISPKDEGEIEEAQWGQFGEILEGAGSCCHGHANTVAMAEAGSDAARWMLALEINGHADWYLPSRDELELCYRNLKPSAHENYCTFRDGDNPSSVPVGYPYASDSPAQAKAEAFQEEGTEAFATRLYWSSTQCSSYDAWGQHFSDGSQHYFDEHYELRARAVRRVKLSH
ncbi:DUF1566 domain-containing protein [Aidingimonas halophila]|uniref:Lcl C-terminal domain-containing protein n=1 Tax=Aidingimonas halophila TaxID=574349 RepID=A0A1H2RH81_9GAMM|nr:DUF1566 domain-containing protein [Aidingimonas halophila]GHC19259.1 hypothetical protein GCM10008094_06540 [Aidingimonas halophila]SDW18530.1 Protein of unknown function [Aidingimonas halophila]